jgi:hypothetical protein
VAAVDGRDLWLLSEDGRVPLRPPESPGTAPS